MNPLLIISIFIGLWVVTTIWLRYLAKKEVDFAHSANGIEEDSSISEGRVGEIKRVYGVARSQATFPLDFEGLPLSVRAFFTTYDSLTFDGYSYLDSKHIHKWEEDSSYFVVGFWPGGEPVLVRSGKAEVFLGNDEYTVGNNGIGLFARDLDDFIVKAAKDFEDSKRILKRWQAGSK